MALSTTAVEMSAVANVFAEDPDPFTSHDSFVKSKYGLISPVFDTPIVSKLVPVITIFELDGLYSTLSTVDVGGTLSFIVTMPWTAVTAPFSSPIGRPETLIK